MKNKVLAMLALCSAMFAAAALQAAELGKGDWVLAQYRGSAYWFPGVVESTDGDAVTIVYDDGERETRPANQVKAYNWREGSRVECRWKGGDEWYPGRIDSVGGDGESIHVSYDDGDAERTKTRHCRSR